MTLLTTFDERQALVLDVDGTLLEGPESGRVALRRALEPVREGLVLVYVSGQNLEELIQAINALDLLLPDYIVSAVGTEIHRMPGEQPLDEWERYVRAGFDREAIIDFVSGLDADLQFQPPEQQTPLKVSCFWPGATSQQLDELRSALLAVGLPIKLIYSRDLYLDIIPERAGLGPAVKFLVDSLVLFPNQVFVCGDSGNDIELYQYGFRGIVVDNAARELKVAAELRAYFSHEAYAAGVLEGLRHYNFFGPPRPPRQRDPAGEGYDRAVESLRRNLTPMGFSAAGQAENPLTDDDSNYFAVWGRDGVKTGLWSLPLNDADVNDCFRRTLALLAEHQTESGQIPSNVRIKNNEPDYGGIGGIASVDSVIWFVIGVARYAAYTGDMAFLREMYRPVSKAMTWLRAHDSNNCGLIEIPESSDWMDLFPRSYNVLYDEVLWYLACRDFYVVQEVMGDDSRSYRELTEHIRQQIRRRFWPTAKTLSETQPSFSERQFTLGEAQYMLAQISPFDFSWRCDVYANLLAALTGLLDERQAEQLYQFLWGVGANLPYPVKCLYPPVNSGASDWKDYFITNFLNLPDHYHNGGIWPFIGGLWVRFLTQVGRRELAQQELRSLTEACRKGIYGEWEFNEWLHGQTGRPMGKAHQAWSSASYIAAYTALHRDDVRPDFEPLTVEMFGGVAEEAEMTAEELA